MHQIYLRHIYYPRVDISRDDAKQRAVLKGHPNQFAVTMNTWMHMLLECVNRLEVWGWGDPAFAVGSLRAEDNPAHTLIFRYHYE